MGTTLKPNSVVNFFVIDNKCKRFMINLQL